MRIWEIIAEDGRIVPGVNTTGDVTPGEIMRQADKYGLGVDARGIPAADLGFGCGKRRTRRKGR